MRKSRYSNHQIAVILNLVMEDLPIPTVCCEYGISSSTVYNWRRNYRDNTKLLFEARQEALDNLDRLRKKHDVRSPESCAPLNDAFAKN